VPFSELKERCAHVPGAGPRLRIVVREMAGSIPSWRTRSTPRTAGRNRSRVGVHRGGFRPCGHRAASRELYVFNFYHGSNGRSTVPAAIVAPSILVQEWRSARRAQAGEDALPQASYFEKGR